MSIVKKKKIDQYQIQLAKQIFYIEPTFKEPFIIHNQFKKMKPLTGISRAFKEYNKRYFTINFDNFIFYYTEKEFYSLSDMTYIPLEEITEISDKPHYSLSNEGIQWKDAFGITIYLNDNYIVLVAQTNDIYEKWLNYFEAIRFRNTGRSLLKRYRTQPQFPPNSPPEQVLTNNQQQLTQPNENQQQLQTVNKEKFLPEEEQKVTRQEIKEDQTRVKRQQSGEQLNQKSELQIQFPQPIEEQKKQTVIQIPAQKEEKSTNNNFEMDQFNQKLKKTQEINQPIEQLQHIQEKVTKPSNLTQTSLNKQDFKLLNSKESNEPSNSSDKKSVDTNIIEGENEKITIIKSGSSSKKNEMKEENRGITIAPKRLDTAKGKKANQHDSEQFQQPSQIRKSTNQPVNIWEERDDDGKIIKKPNAMLSNFLDYEKNNDDQIIDFSNDQEKQMSQNEKKKEEISDDDFDENQILNSILGIDEGVKQEEKQKLVESQRAVEKEMLAKKVEVKDKFFLNDEEQDQDNKHLKQIQVDQPYKVQSVKVPVAKKEQNYDDWDEDV